MRHLARQIVILVIDMQLQKIRGLIGNEQTADIDAVRLVMLYALRYEKHPNNDVMALTQALRRRGIPDKLTKVSVTFLKTGVKLMVEN